MVQSRQHSQQRRRPWHTECSRCLLQAKRLAQEDAAAAATQARPQDFERHAEAARERWDVESVLSLRSNLDNHPASIAEPQSSRRPRQQVGTQWSHLAYSR